MEELRERLATIEALRNALAVMGWDEETYMPEGGSPMRAEHLARIARVAHEMARAPEMGALLDDAARSGLHPESLDSDLVRVARRDYERATKVPSSLVAEIRRHAALAHPIWVRARQHNDFPAFAPVLDRTLSLAREMADHLGYDDEPYDALLDAHEPGMTTRQVDVLFRQLKERLIPLAADIRAQGRRNEDAVLRGRFEEADQERFGLMMIRRFGFDLTRGRLDRVVHPFEVAFSRDDVRITTRYDETYLTDSLFSTLHEAGHGMYEQGVGAELAGTPLSSGASSALHESQSRLWENVVGRSRPLWQHFYPALQETFPAQLRSVPLDDFYRAINRVEPSFIRVDADEITYNLHIMLRYEMERGLLSGEISTAEAADAWNDKMEEYLGIRPPTDTLGILQDTHWADGLIGYFPTYTMGNVLSVQFYQRAVEEHPDINEEMARGEFGGLRRWLEHNVYRHGRRYEPNDLVRRATGEEMNAAPYLHYLESKFRALYSLESAARR